MENTVLINSSLDAPRILLLGDVVEALQMRIWPIWFDYPGLRWSNRVKDPLHQELGGNRTAQSRYERRSDLRGTALMHTKISA